MGKMGRKGKVRVMQGELRVTHESRQGEGWGAGTNHSKGKARPCFNH